jgi:hypothetical protein
MAFWPGGPCREDVELLAPVATALEVFYLHKYTPVHRVDDECLRLLADCPLRAVHLRNPAVSRLTAAGLRHITSKLEFLNCSGMADTVALREVLDVRRESERQRASTTAAWLPSSPAEEA